VPVEPYATISLSAYSFKIQNAHYFRQKKPSLDASKTTIESPGSDFWKNMLNKRKRKLNKMYSLLLDTLFVQNQSCMISKKTASMVKSKLVRAEWVRFPWMLHSERSGHYEQLFISLFFSLRYALQDPDHLKNIQILFDPLNIFVGLYLLSS
jgi:hypothetical protein